MSNNQQISLDDVLKSISCSYKVVGDTSNVFITGAKPIDHPDGSVMSFIAGDRKDKSTLIQNAKTGVIICDAEASSHFDTSRKNVLIVVDNPKQVFAELVNKIFVKKPVAQIHPTAYIEPGAQIGKNVYIGPFCYVGNSIIGDNSILFGNCHIYDNVVIGKDVEINSGCSIGADGFGYIKNSAGEIENFPHIGGVVIEDKVHIGSNTCIDRGALGNTTIKKGAKIDNLVHIAHNVVIGENAFVIADSMIGGSTTIGDNSWLAPSAVLRDGLRIGKNVVVGMAAVITKNIGDNETWAGNPGREISDFVKLNNAQKNLIAEKSAPRT